MSRDGSAKSIHCQSCDQDVTPVVKGWSAGLFMWLTLLALASLVASLVAAAHPFTQDTMHGLAIVVLWPVVAVEDGWVHHNLLAVLLAFVTLLAVGNVWGKLHEHAERNARCPRCAQQVGATPAAQA